MPTASRAAIAAGLLASSLAGCSDEGAGDAEGAAPCLLAEFETGDPFGHGDPYGAKAAGQARAGILAREADVVQPAHGRQRIEVGDFVLVNDKIAVAIEKP